MKKLIYIIILAFFAGCNTTEPEKTQKTIAKKYQPEWAQDLIIYEIATKSFTSPDGPGSGTFQSTAAKMEYLADLGINGIWLTGHNWANDHFYNIWTQYACIRQDSIDPSLGTPDDFKALIDEAHKHDIKIFLDVITHGVVNSSPLIKEKPEWFIDGSWGMTDFDYFGNHPDFEKWWVETWLRYILEFGVDGFRIDCDIYRPDLWNEIRKKALDNGKEIIFFSETATRYPGMTDSRQYVVNIASHDGLVKDHQFIQSPANHLNQLFNFYENEYFIEVSYEDDEILKLSSNDSKVISINHLAKEITGNNFLPYKFFTTEIKILLDNAEDSIKGLKITQFEDGFKHYEQSWWAWNRKSHHPNEAHCKISGDTLIAYFPEIPPQEELTFLQISCHDGGWQGFPKDENPYSVQGSRCVIGYSGLLTPTVPIFFMGEEFNANYHPLPSHKGSLYGDKGEEGEGRWMYAAMLDWSEIDQQKHQDMLNDVNSLIDVRKSNSDLFNGWAIQSGIQIEELDFQCDEDIPVPFIVWNNQKAIIVVGNNLEKEVAVEIKIPEKKLTFAPEQIINQWTGAESKYNKKMRIKIKPDKSPQGGLGIFKLQ